MEKLNIEGSIKLEENIYLLKNFLDNKTLSRLVDMAENANEWDPNLEQINPFWRNKTTDVTDKSITDYMNFRQIPMLNNNYRMNGNDKISRQMVGGENLNVHCDNPGVDDKNVHDDGTRWGLITYLNDFNGGEIFYPELDIEYKPEPGDLIIHPASMRYKHGTKTVLEGPDRYIITSFGILLNQTH